MSNKPKKATEKARKQTKSGLAVKLGISRSTLHAWEQRGCPVADGDEAVLSWAMKTTRRGFESDEIRAAKLSVLTETARRLRLSNEAKEGLMISKHDIEFCTRRVVSLLLDMLDRYGSVEWPASLVGLNEAAIATRIKADVETLKVEFIAGLKGMMAEDPTSVAEG